MRLLSETITIYLPENNNINSHGYRLRNRNI